MEPFNHWAHDAIFYHIYPLGFCGAPSRNDFTSPPVNRLDKIRQWLPHIQRLGVNALYLGPVFESSAHGYDTANYYEVDRRLGDRQALAQLSTELHQSGIRLILDGVFNHVGRDFWAFRDVQRNLRSSAYKDWFADLRFDVKNPYGDPFTYQTWNGHHGLVCLNLRNPDVSHHIFDAIRLWVQEYSIDGLRLDVADRLDFDFLHFLREFCSQLRPDFWLMGEVVHGDYRRWVNADALHSVTNYECYKALYSSLLEKNYFEVAYALNRQFGSDGIYARLPLYNFADNHDVNRVASNLANPAHLYPLYLLLFTMPGLPSIYYGSEWGLEAKRTFFSDAALRPDLDLERMTHQTAHPRLVDDISRLADIRKSFASLRYGEYSQLHVAHEQFAFARFTEEEYVIVMLNSADSPAHLEVPVPPGTVRAVDILNQGEEFTVRDSTLRVSPVFPRWGRILKLRSD
jgi:cyclomaltodextrinase / maltogenic alpha-amylase / neopullulanase